MSRTDRMMRSTCRTEPIMPSTSWGRAHDERSGIGDRAQRKLGGRPATVTAVNRSRSATQLAAVVLGPVRMRHRRPFVANVTAGAPRERKQGPAQLAPGRASSGARRQEDGRRARHLAVSTL
jgi:hypothetical protein